MSASLASKTSGSWKILTIRNSRPSLSHLIVVRASGYDCGAPLRRGSRHAGNPRRRRVRGLEGGPCEAPEGGEVPVRHVREPESEKDHIVCVIRAPVEQVGPDVADGGRWAGLLERLISSTAGEASTAVIPAA